MRRMTVYFNREGHVSRLVSALFLLSKASEIHIDFVENTDNFRNVPHAQIVEVEVDQRTIAFDMCDAFALNNEKGQRYLEKVDLYFKRSYNKTIDLGLPEEALHKIRPYGFDYYLTCPGNPLDRKPTGAKAIARKFVRDITGYSASTYPPFFEKKADQIQGKPSIFFMTRLWDPEELRLDSGISSDVYAYREYMIEERHKINADRVQIIRELQRIYGKCFIGGVQDSEFARRYSPDVILPVRLTRRKPYLQKMQSSDICIGSMGLHKSIGWKTGEYVAASRAIVAERFAYEVPGGFLEGKNYLPFDNVDACLSSVERLFNNLDEIYRMKRQNELYYKDYLEPVQQIKNALRQWDYGD